ncbi:MAG: tRNA (N(6)-L-threonylcarbamoyladenosine(37)-C(2))-methylthiotransferase MtaB [Bacteroidales bacterium]|nr:tRNA (N(6)-L-threonylcarbamoyladenosine(37)-C(2))-methylthiotransferase MtaB [Bacteroidales bacterium]
MLDTTLLRHKKVTYHTLGCKLNFAETATVQRTLEEEGCRTAAKGEVADICVVNTCSVTDVADHKCRNIIRKLGRDNPGAFVLVMGCYAQLEPDQVADIEGVDLVLGMEQKGEVVRYLAERIPQKANPERMGASAACHEAVAVPISQVRTFVPSCSRGDRTRYFLKVQDGCNYYCTYCTIPMARGRSRNGSIASLVAQAEQAAAEGGHEIVLTGVNMGDFGRSTRETFYDLVRALDGVEGVARYRISSIEPNLLSPDIIRYCAASKRFTPYFHIPLQSGSDAVLKLMRRHYDTTLFAERVAEIRRTAPDAFIGVDVIVGTRGETAELFEETYRFVEGLDVSELHVFTYSERPGTEALKIAHVVKPHEKKQRTNRLLALSEAKRRAFYERFVGTTRPVLWEHKQPNQPRKGFTDNYIRVAIAPECEHLVTVNLLCDVRLGSLNAQGDALIGYIDDITKT